MKLFLFIIGEAEVQLSGFGGLELACWSLVPMFAGSNPAEAKKSSVRILSEGK